MRTKLDPDDEFFIPDVSEWDWSKAEVGRYARGPGEKTEIFVDGAIGYQLRLLPSNKVLTRFESTLEAWPAVIEAVARGRSPRTLALDATMADGSVVKVSAGPRLVMWARHNNGESRRYEIPVTQPPGRRVAEG